MTHPAIDYSRYQTLAITRRGVNDAVIDIQMKAQNGKLPTAGHEGHWELSEIWRDIDKDDSVRCAVLRESPVAIWRWCRTWPAISACVPASGKRRATWSTT